MYGVTSITSITLLNTVGLSSLTVNNDRCLEKYKVFEFVIMNKILSENFMSI